MTTINIIGTGNVAWHIATALQKAEGYTLQAVAGRSTKSLNDFNDLASQTTPIDLLPPSDMTMILVADDVIQEISTKIPYTTGVFVHSSGSVPMSVLSSFKNYGVFYPLQTFSKEVAVLFKEIPICIETHDDTSAGVLKKLGFALSENVTEISSEQRKKLHLAAVFVNNFTNHCFTIAQDLCTQNELSFDILRPLLNTTATKALAYHPNTVQTGPAKRNDKETMKTHLEQLTNVQQEEVYKVLSKAISTYYGKKL